MSPPSPNPVQRHYDTFPYPDTARLVWPDRAESTLGILAYTAGFRAQAPLSIWVAGCGTLQAAELALRHPDARLLATDLSPETLRRAEAVARAAGVAERIEFRHHDLSTPPPEGAFELIDCIGVIHHMAEPGVGLSHLAARLAPGGLVDLMVYQRDHRRPFNRLRDTLRALAGPLGAPTPALADWLTARIADASHVPEELRDAAREMLDTGRDRPSHCADTLLHPHELGFTPRTLFELANRAGLRFAGFAHPGLWAPDTYFDDPELLAALNALPDVERAEALTLLLGGNAPYLDVRFRRADDGPAPGLPNDRALMAGALVPHGPWRFLELDPKTQAPRGQGIWAPHPEDDGTLEITERGQTLIVSAEDMALLKRIGRGVTCEEALADHARAHRQERETARPDFIAALRRLLEPPVSLLVFEPAEV